MKLFSMVYSRQAEGAFVTVPRGKDRRRPMHTQSPSPPTVERHNFVKFSEFVKASSQERGKEKQAEKFGMFSLKKKR